LGAVEPKEATVDEELWRWIWLGVAAVFGVGEIITAGFFLLPFAAGAVVAAILAFLDVAPAIQGIVFVVVSIIALVWLRRFAAKGDDHQPAVGANRHRGATAIVMDPIDRLAGTGLVRIGREEWRATTESEPIAEGSKVKVIGFRGTRLVVEPLAPPAPESAAEQED
jgi:membrane protein implicated in regulation of membrane protease activity